MPPQQPRAQPSFSSSSVPSIMPSVMPSDRPEQLPSRQPSPYPSEQPFLLPSSWPSEQPTRILTLLPSSNPTRVSFVQPSLKPKESPSSQPFLQPSLQPFLLSSHQPTTGPTRFPSVQPSLTIVETKLKSFTTTFRSTVVTAQCPTIIHPECISVPSTIFCTYYSHWETHSRAVWTKRKTYLCSIKPLYAAIIYTVTPAWYRAYYISIISTFITAILPAEHKTILYTENESFQLSFFATCSIPIRTTHCGSSIIVSIDSATS